MARIVVFLACEPEGGGLPVTLAETGDRAAIVSAASAALKESRDRIGVLGRQDALLGELQRAESDRLEQALRLAVPELELRTRPN
jgi:hypothetical protein